MNTLPSDTLDLIPAEMEEWLSEQRLLYASFGGARL